MDYWGGSFLWVALLLAVMCWWVTRRFWFEGLPWLVRLPLVLVGTFFAMIVIGAFAAILVHMVNGHQNLLGPIAENPSGAVAYFSEVGAETGVFWLPIMLIRTVVLAIGSWRKRRLAA